MHAGALRALEFHRIVDIVTGLTVTPAGRDRLAELHPMTDAARVVAAQRATTEGARFLADHQGFPLRAPADLEQILIGLAVVGRPLEPLRLFGLAEFLESIELSRGAVRRVGGAFPLLSNVVATVASFRDEINDVRRKIDASGEVADNASPLLSSIRDRLRRQKQRLRTTLDGFVRNRDTSKYLQEQVVTDRNGRHVLMVRAEHRGSIPGIVHGASASGASLFLEPMVTVEINNDIVELEEEELEEVRRILLALTDAFRDRPDDLQRTIDIATELDVIQARARFSQIVGGIEAVISPDGTFELRGARHPLLMASVRSREPLGDTKASDGASESRSESKPPAGPVPVDILLIPPVRILLVTGPNTGGKTVAIKTAGLLAAMAQAGLHIPVEDGSRLPVFRSLFADIGDEQSISASLSTFSAHITNVVSMDRDLVLPALVLLDEVGAGTDPIEGGALGTAVIDHFRKRGSHLIATTHYDSLKTYASTTDGVVSSAFGFNPDTFAPTYKLIYGSPGRSLALEIAARHGMPASVIAAARANIGEREKQLAEHLARVDEDLRGLQRDRSQVARERAATADTEKKLRAREEALRDREDALRRRLDAKLDDQLRAARREIDIVIEGLKTRAAELTEKASRRLVAGPDRIRAAGISTGDTGTVRGDARAALDEIVGRLKDQTNAPAAAAPAPVAIDVPLEPGVRVTIGGLGLEGTIVELRGKLAEIDVRGKRLRAPLRDLRVIGGHAGSATRQPAYGSEHAGAAAGNPAYRSEAGGRAGAAEGGPAVAGTSRVHVNVSLQPREAMLSELNVIGCTVDEALTRAEKFLDQSTMSDQLTLRIVHGHGSGQLRRAIGEFLRNHPLVASYALAPQDQGGGGATIVELKD